MADFKSHIRNRENDLSVGKTLVNVNNFLSWVSWKWVKTTYYLSSQEKSSEWSARQACEVKAPLFTTSVTGTSFWKRL